MSAPPIDEKAVFNIARRIDAREAREDYLRQVCGADEDALRRVVELLQVHENEQSFLESPAVAVPNSPTLDQPAVRPGTQIGPYKLIEQIGEGGMGTVWMAQQSEPVKRVVALKLIKAGMDSRQVIARFEAERQALALMDHANIARVLDAGTTPFSPSPLAGEGPGVRGGLPYFVMDLVRGVPITRYCDEHHLTPRQRLELFIPVCQAIQHAHQKGIIHRDLKPSNVLVALYDGKPLPKVIDFGVAKATGQSLTDKTLVTGFGNIVGTLEYMSPEQAEVNQLDIDTRSDIYSLGVLLYELLTGSPPFSRKELEKAGMLEMLRVIREEEPSKPSTKLSTAEGLPTLAANRGTEPAKLTRLVRGELDWIVMKALEKDRNRRYETANGFAMDVQRYLADEPVLACPPSAGYRLRKFSRRNKVGLAVSALVLFFLVLLGSGVGWAVRDRATRRAIVAGQVESILAEVDLLESAQKWPEALAAARRAEAVVSSGADAATAERVRQRLKDLKFIDRLDRIRQNLAVTVLGKLDRRGTAREYALAFQEYGVDVDALPRAEAVARLGARPALAAPVAAALDSWAHARWRAGEAWEPLIEVARGLDPDRLRDQLRAVVYRPVTPEAQAELRHLAESIDVKDHPPATLEILAAVLLDAQLADAAVRLLRAGQYAYPNDFWLNLQLGAYLMDLRRDYAMAVRYCAAAVSLRPDSAPAHNNLGTALLYHDHGAKWDEAIGEYRKAIEIDPKHDQAYGNLGALWCDFARDYDKAIECFLKAIDLDPSNADHHFNLGNALRDQLKLPAAVAAYRKAIELNPRHVRVRQNLALVLATGPDPKVRDPRLAVEHAKKMVELEQQSKKPELEQRSSMALQVLGWAQYRAGAWRESIEALEESCKLQKGGTGDAFQWIALALAHAKLSEEAGLPEKERAHHKAEARRLYEQADRQIDGRWRARPSEAFEQAVWDFHAEARELMGTKDTKK